MVLSVKCRMEELTQQQKTKTKQQKLCSELNVFEWECVPG